MRKPVTVEDLLVQWRLRRIAYREQAQGIAAVEEKNLETALAFQAALSMDYQLAMCIEMLEGVLNGDYQTENLLRSILEVAKNESEPE